MRGKSDTDALVARQHGVISRRQLIALGLGPHAIDRRLHAGRLHVVHRGVFAVGHGTLTREGRWMAAVLACGDGAALSHQTAAAARDLRRAGTMIHVTIPGRAGRKAPRGVRLYRSPTLTAAQVHEYRGIPVTTVARTIIDLSRTLKSDELEELVHRADDRGLVDFRELRAARSASLQAVLRGYDPAPTRSALERRFLRLCRDHGLERPEVNAYIEGYLVDFVWRDRKLIVEVDGYEHHRSRRKFESDRERDVVLATKGWAVRRFTWRQITHREAWVAAAVRTGARALAE